MGAGNAAETRLPCSRETREDYLRPLLRNGETWDSLLRRLAEQYTAETEDYPPARNQPQT